MTQSDTSSTVVVGAPRTPIPMISTLKRKQAMTMFIAGPPTMMTSFCHHGLR